MSPPESLWDCIGDASHEVLICLPRNDISALMRVSKASYAHAVRALYSHLDWPALWWFYSCPKPEIVLCLRTLIERPSLADLVQTLSLTSPPGTAVQDQVEPISVDELDLVAAEAAIDGLGIPVQHFATEWKSQLSSGSLDAVVTLLLSRLANLRSLTMELLYTKDNRLLGHYLRSFLRDSDTASRFLARLKNLQYTHEWPVWGPTQRGMNTEAAASLFYVRRVRSLAVSLDNPETFAWPLPYRPDLSALTTLELCFIRESQLHHILSLTPNVKHFKYHWYYNSRCEHESNKPCIDLGALAAGLNFLRGTLEQLHILAFVWGVEENTLPLLTIEGTLTDLATFPYLADINVPMVMLMGSWTPRAAVITLADTLPSSLVALTISRWLYPHEVGPERDPLNDWDDWAVHSEIIDWFVIGGDLRTNLQRLTVEHHQWSTELIEHFIKVSDGCQFQLGIHESGLMPRREPYRRWYSWDEKHQRPFWLPNQQGAP